MRWLLRLLVSAADRRAIENDLAELYELRRQREGARAAARWLRRQRMLYPWHLLFDRLRSVVPGSTTMQHLWNDLRYSLRSLARVPVLSVTIVLTVGVGLGATTGVISLVRAVLVNPLPYAHPESLVWIYTDNPPYRFSLSVVDYRALEADHPTFSSLSASQQSFVTVTDGPLAERVSAKAVTGSYFPLLGQKPHIGRLFEPADDERRSRSVVLTHAYWTRRFGGDGSVLGRTLTMDGVGYTIVGVLQRTAGPLEHDLALFTVADWPAPTRKGPFFTTVLARLRPGVSRTAALSTLHATNRRLFPIWRSSYQDRKATWGMLDLKERVIGDLSSMLFFVLAAVGCVLLIACANAVNLVIARGLHRSRELAIRGALGASRARLLQHTLVETGVLIVGAGLVGWAVAIISLQLVAAHGAAYIPRIDEVRLVGETFVWLAGLSLATSIVMGVVPAWHSSRLRVDEALKAGGRSTSDGRAARRVRRALVTAEFALATPLLIAGGLVLASLHQLTRVPVGIDTARILTASVSLPASRYARDEDRAAFWKRALHRLAALPGVEAAALADSRPPEDISIRNNFDLEDRPTPPGQNQPISSWVGVSPEFFKTVRLRLQRGRLLDERSLQEDVVVVDRAWADRFFPGQEALGRRFHSGGCTRCPWTTVVGVVDNVKWTGLDAPEDGTVYSPFVDLPDAFFVLRAAGDPASLSLSLRQALKELDLGLALSDIATGDELVAEALVTPRYLSVLIGMFALTALVLSVIGIYGVMAYFVQQHTRDIGIRLALGGDPARVRHMVVLQGLRLVLVGVTVGIGAALLASRLMATILFDVSPTDPLTIVGVAATLVVVALLVCLVPAHRAAGIDPATVLRES
ncbi:MAG: ABC transporter permease [Vicinamibacteraceae bacterium]